MIFFFTKTIVPKRKHPVSLALPKIIFFQIQGDDKKKHTSFLDHVTYNRKPHFTRQMLTNVKICYELQFWSFLQAQGRFKKNMSTFLFNKEIFD